MIDAVADGLIGLLTLASYLQWLRVAQREHYEPGRVFAIAGIWLRAAPLNGLLLFIVVLGCVTTLSSPVVGVLFALAWLAWPLGMRAKLPAFTDRAKRLTAIVVAVHVIVAVVLGLRDAISVLPLTVMPITELGLLITRPIEQSLAKKWQVQAAEKLRRVSPRVVAITGSYGKTSTKNYAQHLMAGRWSALASPASFNNVLGLSRAVNDRLEPGTDVFVAEMGTYGPGEIARLTELFPPEVAAITTIGEAHLERMKNRETIVRAKREILPPARTIVLNVDVPELAAAADEFAATKRVIRCSTEAETVADVRLVGSTLTVDGVAHEVVLPAEVDHPSNVAVAVGLALAVDVPVETIVSRLSGVPATPHRAETARREDGLVVIDDTFNSNPTGAAAALARAQSLAGEGGTVWTITPGMVELGSQQAARNADFARSATAGERLRLCVVGRTNRKALMRGDRSRTMWFRSREDAAGYVMGEVGPGDVVLYENDLPDHYA